MSIMGSGIYFQFQNFNLIRKSHIRPFHESTNLFK